MKLVWTNGENSDFLFLCRELDRFLNALVGGEANRAQYIPHNLLDDIHDVALVYDGERPVGCAGLKRYDETMAEVKRVFVAESHRGKGISREIMRQLEQRARALGYRSLVLESGEPLTAAMGLYRSLGYRRIPNYGPYVGMDASVCLKKEIADG